MQKYPPFQDLENLDPGLQQVLTASGFRTMTEIQARTWEASVSGKDVVGHARVGTGKTITFLLPSIQRILDAEFGLSELLKRPPPLDLEGDMMRVANELRKGEAPELVESAEELYRSLFGCYNMRLAALGVTTKEILFEMVNAMAVQAGLHMLRSFLRSW